MKIEARLEELGFVLPAPLALPAGARLPFPWVRVRGKRVFISGHGPQQPDGSLAGPFGKVGAEVSTEQAYESLGGALSIIVGAGSVYFSGHRPAGGGTSP